MSAAYFATKADMVRALGVKRGRLYEWCDRPDFPKPHKTHGWPKDAVLAWVDAHRAKVEEMQSGDGDKAEKTRLECARLRVVIDREKEVLEQTRVETSRQKGELHNVKECRHELDRIAAGLRASIENTRQHETAKHPEHVATIDAIADAFLSGLESIG